MNDPEPSCDRYAVRVRGLVKRFGDHRALRNVDIQAAPGEIVAVLGPNGAGKTTLVSILSTLLTPDGGTAEICGYDVVAAAHRVREQIAVVGQSTALDTMLTGAENLRLFGRLRGLDRAAARSRSKELLVEYGLAGVGDQRLHTYSGGMRRRIDLACALVVPPAVLMLDEPTTGLDPAARRHIRGRVVDLARSGVAIVLTTQYLEEADQLADTIVVIDGGAVIARGSSDQLKSIVGSDRCEVRPRRDIDRDRVLDALAAVAPVVDNGTLVFPAPAGMATLAEQIVALQNAGLADRVEVALRRATLDEVYFHLTEGAAAAGAPR